MCGEHISLGFGRCWSGVSVYVVCCVWKIKMSSMSFGVKHLTPDSYF